MSFVSSRLTRASRVAFILAAVTALVPQATIARPAPDSFADLANRLLPTVVNIATSQTLKSGPQVGLEVPPDSPLQDLFKDFLGPQNVPRHVTSLGSGFIIDPAGLIVTNNHVIENADQITVNLNDGTSLPAKLIGRDDKTDLALLKVQPKKPLPATHWGNSDTARIGDWVIAIGNPFGLGSTVTAGIVSARNRDISAGPYDDFIQTDAPINRGNSGGPLFDMDGNVVGVNSAIFSPSGGSVGIGFSIPSNLAHQVMDQLHKFGTVRRGWLGVRVQAVNDDLAEGFGLSSRSGALVAEVSGNGPAAHSGLHKGDLIVRFDGKPVADNRALPRLVADAPVGKKVSIEYLRAGRKMSAQVIVGKLPGAGNAPPPKKPSASLKGSQHHASLGLSLASIDGEARAKYRIGKDVQGVVVTAVDPRGPAAEKSIRPGDVIVEVQNQAVRSPDDVSKRVEADAKAGKKVEVMLLNRGGNLAFVALRLG
ncbi:MAG: DegQ family serine endoprotease [Alphaproteobacteria bacterium]|nr:DegQ family serine endoprotease [Alphaproteobacteria bacterium]